MSSNIRIMKEESISKTLKKLRKKAKSDLDQQMIENDRLVKALLKVRPLSYSAMKEFAQSPQHFIEYISKKRKDPSDAMIQGTIFDVMLLTPDDFEKTFHIMPKIDKRTKIGKAEYAHQLEICEGKTVITQEMFDTALAMLKSIVVNKDAMYYIDKFKFNQTKMEWVDHATKLKCIGYTDGESDIEDKDYFICDIKTARDGSENGFIRAAHDFGYHLQTGAYTSAAKQRFFKFPDFIHVVIENTSPYAVNVFRSSSEYIEQSQNEWHETLKAFKFCLENNFWHMGYEFHRLGVSYNQINLPGYFKAKFAKILKPEEL